MGEQLFRLNGDPWDNEEMAYSFQEGPATGVLPEPRNGFQVVE